MDEVFSAAEFEWDEYNIEKNWRRHKVRFAECEEVFFDGSLKILPDEGHSQAEKRYLALGQTKGGRLLFVAFTERKGRIRVISARDMSRKERRAYNEKIKEDSPIQK